MTEPTTEEALAKVRRMSPEGQRQFIENLLTTLAEKVEALTKERDELWEALTAYRAAYTMVKGEAGRRSWVVHPIALAEAHDLATRPKGGAHD